MANGNYIPIEIDIDYSKAKNSQQQFLNDMGKLKSSIIDLREENKKLTKEYKDTAKDSTLSTSQQIEKRKQLSQQIAKNEESIKKLSKEQRDARTAYRAVDKGVDAYERMSAELTTLRKKIRGIQAEGGVVSKADLDRADELDKKLKGIDIGLGEFFRKIGNYSSAFDGLIPGGGSGGIGELLNGFKGAVNPVTAAGAALVALTGYVAGVTLEYEKLNNIVTKSTGLVGQNAQEVTARIKAVSNTFNQDFNEVTVATNAFAKQMGISYDEALTLIEKGFLNGADAQGDFLDQLKEYPARLDNANLSAEDLVETIVLANRQGIFSDKALDSLAEADLSLKEFTKTQRDALIPLGQEFADELERGIASGEITTIEALTRIKDRSEEVGLNLRDTATITADIFKGAGEDAGGAADVLEIVYQTLQGSLDDLTISSDHYYQRQVLIFDANKRLSTAEAELAASFAGLGGSLAGVGQNIKAFFVETLNDAIGRIEKLSFYFSGLKSLLKGEGFNKGYVEAVKRSVEATEEYKASTEELTEEQQRQAIQTRLQTEQAKAAADARIKKINEIKGKITELKETLDQIPSEYKFGIVADINKLETELINLGVQVNERIGGGLVNPIATKNLIPETIDATDAINKVRLDQEEKFLNEQKEKRKTNINEILEAEKAALEARQQYELQLTDETLNLVSSIAQGFDRVAQTRDENEKARLDERYAREIELAAGNADQQEQLQKELEAKKKKIDQRAFERSKRLQILEATINFQKGLTNILSLAGTDVFSTPILKAIQIAALVAQYTSSIAAISSAKFAKGGLLKGPGHEQGGVQLFGRSGAYYGEAEGGEPILTKRTSRNKKTLGVLSYINQKYGGDALGGSLIPDDLKSAIDAYVGSSMAGGFNVPRPPLRVYASGGVVQAQAIPTAQQFTKEDLADAVASAMKNVTIITEVRDVVDATDRYNRVLNSAQVS